MKHCPKCSRVYADEGLNFCLDDGEWLAPLESPLDAPTAIISRDDLSSERPTRIEDLPKTRTFDTPETKTRKNSKLILAATVALILLGFAAFAAYKFNFLGKHSIATFQPGKIDRLTGTGDVRNAAISPDGKFVVYLKDEPGQQSLWIIDIATKSTLQLIPPAPTEYTGLNFSPDGNYIYFSRTEKEGMSVLYSVPKLGGTPKRIISGVDSSVTFSPDGRQLAFVRAPETKDGALVVADVDGANERALASLGTPDVFAGQPPAWSPDGKLIAARIYHPEANVYYATLVGVTVADGTLTPLSAHRWDEFFGKMTWEPDGSGLLLSAREKSFRFNDAQIWRVSYPSGEAQQITEGLTSYKNANLSADARYLAIVSDDLLASLWTLPVAQPNAAVQISTTPGTKDGYSGVAWTNDGHVLYGAKQVAKTDIWRMNADGTGQQQLTDSDEVERYLSLPHDDHYVVFDLLRVGGGNVFRADADGGNLRQLTNGSYDVKPHVSPDGRWVAYMDIDSHLWKVSIDGGQPVELSDKITEAPAFSPDGKQIACYYRADAHATWKLELVPAEGGEPTKVFNVATAANTLVGSSAPRNWVVLRWTPDGRSILYIDDKAGASNIWSQPIEGGPPKQITDFKSDLIWTFDISPDGKQLVMSRGRNIDDVILINNANTQ